MADKPKVLKRHYGGAATSQYYWPRPELTDPIFNALCAGESISLFGLRRSGKSSALLEIRGQLERAGKKPVYVDVQGKDRIDSIIGALANAIPASSQSSKITKALSGPRVNSAVEVVNRMIGRPTSGPPTPLAVLQQVELIRGDLGHLFASQNGSIVLIVDELPYLIVNMLSANISVNTINAFLATLRTWRHEGCLPMLFAGSMGIQWLVRERGIAREHFNDLVPYTTPPPLTDEDARAMLLALAAGEDCAWMTTEFVEAILQESAARYPSFLQFAFGRIKDHSARSVPEIAHIFREFIRPSLDETFYDQFDTRLARYEKKENDAARSILRRVDDDFPQPVALQQVDSLLENHEPGLRDHLLLALTEDGFMRVETRDRTISLSSPLVHTWWQSKPYKR